MKRIRVIRLAMLVVAPAACANHTGMTSDKSHFPSDSTVLAIIADAFSRAGPAPVDATNI